MGNIEDQTPGAPQADDAPGPETVQAAVQPTHRLVPVLCGSCQAAFEFPVEAKTVSFGFDCTNCGAHNEVNLTQ